MSLLSLLINLTHSCLKVQKKKTCNVIFILLLIYLLSATLFLLNKVKFQLYSIKCSVKFKILLFW